MHHDLRNAQASDHERVIAVVDAWWGRNVADMLPKLFFKHFENTSFIAEQHGQLTGFLIGFLSQSRTNEAYIHFVGVHPEQRKHGLARTLYERFFEVARDASRSTVGCVTSPYNQRSIAFHRALGFEIVPGDSIEDGVSVHSNYDGKGVARVQFRRDLTL
jgi:predicted GNAT superfamily acetyltransferase